MAYGLLPGLISVLALAQHNGVPTRLLDWTWRPRIAAYFAAEEVVMRDSEPPGDQLAVWACKHRFVTMVGRSREPSFCMQVVTAPQATNLNLAAQAGGLYFGAGPPRRRAARRGNCPEPRCWRRQRKARRASGNVEARAPALRGATPSAVARARRGQRGLGVPWIRRGCTLA